MRGSKQVRQMLLNELAVNVLRSCPSLLHSSVLRQSIEQTREHTSGDYYAPYLEEWERLLGSGEVERIALHVLANDEHGRALRVTSPLGFLLTPEQRSDIAVRAARMPTLA